MDKIGVQIILLFEQSLSSLGCNKEEIFSIFFDYTEAMKNHTSTLGVGTFLTGDVSLDITHYNGKPPQVAKVTI